jgi:hypothetical protein
VLAALSLLALSGSALAQITPAARPVYRVGDQWPRSDGTLTLTRIDHGRYVFTQGSSREIHLTRDLGVARIVDDGVVDFDLEPAVAPVWPLRVGQSGSRAATWRSPRPPDSSEARGHFGGTVQVLWRVEAGEDLSFGGRALNTFRILYEFKSPNTSRGGYTGNLWKLVLWYAPERGQFVKGEGSFSALSFDLPSSDVAGDAPRPADAPRVADAPTAPAMPGAPPPPPPPPTSGGSPTPVAPRSPLPRPAAAEGPRITINYPSPETRIEREQILIVGLVTDADAVDKVQVTVNGVEAPVPRESGDAKGRAIRVPATLQPGENVVEITATNRAGQVSQVVRTVTRVVPEGPAPATPKIGSRYAVVIGVGQYDHASIPKLKYATPDAEAIYQFLTTRGGYPKDNVVLLTDNTPDKPTLQNIRRALGDFLYRRPAREDMVLIYYAGHGAPEVDAAGTESDGISKYLIPRNADPESLYSTALPMDEIQRIFGRIQAERVVMMLDTCYSGSAGGRTFTRQQLRSNRLNDQFLERLTRSKGRVIITAAGPNEVALETAELGHGLFTYYLLEGLGGRADRDGDGIVTVSELYEYLEHEVDRRARAVGGRQRPLMRGEIEGTLPLSRVAR